MNRTTNYNYYTLRAHDSRSEGKIAALAVAVALATSVVIGAFFTCGIDLTLVTKTLTSDQFAIMAGVAFFLGIVVPLFLSSQCVKNSLADRRDAREDRFCRDLLRQYPAE